MVTYLWRHVARFLRYTDASKMIMGVMYYAYNYVFRVSKMVATYLFHHNLSLITTELE